VKDLADQNVCRELLDRIDELQRQLEQEGQLRRDAEAALQAFAGRMDEFVSLASHDVATPLAPVIGFTDLFLKKWRDREDPECVELLEMIREQAGKSLKMLRALAHYAHQGYRPRPEHPVDSSAPLDEALAVLQLRFNGIDLPLQRKDLPAVRVPEPYLRQVWEILLANVVCHAGPQRIPVMVGGSRTGEVSQLFIRDHGVGVPKSMAEDIFRLFPRGVDPGQGKGPGSGLATLARIAGFYGGRTWLEETPGGGCTFRVEFSEIQRPGEQYAF